MDRYVAMEKFSKVAVAADATANYIEFACPYTPTGLIAQVLTKTSGAVNVTGLAVTFASGKIKVAVTDLGEGDTVSVIAFA
jgi:hypothetical protein